MRIVESSTTGPTRLPLPTLLAALILLAPAVAPEAAAQSDAGTVNATVTVEAVAISVTGVSDLTFGTHFATEGTVPNEQAAVWAIDVSSDPTNVDLTLTLLPQFLIDGAGLNEVLVLYGPDSFGANCAGILVPADPFVGIQNCDISPGLGFATLGDETLGLAPVQVDLTGAPAELYSATIELTATVN